jgi:hypothetical protein
MSMNVDSRARIEVMEGRNRAHLWTPYLYVVVPVVMKVQYSVYLRVTAYMKIVCVLHALADGLPRVLLHLDVVELPATEHTQ